MILSYKYRLFTTPAQEMALTEMLGAFCDLYNACLHARLRRACVQQRIEAYQRRAVSLRYGNQAAELKVVREADERLARYSISAEQQVLRRLDKTFSAFFRRIKHGAKAGFPRFRAKTQFDSAEMRVGDGLTIRKSKHLPRPTHRLDASEPGHLPRVLARLGIVGIPGKIKVKWHRDLPIDAKLGAAVVSRKAGKWYACF